MPSGHCIRRGTSMIGMLITMLCIVVLFVIGMTALNKATTGEGSPLEGTVRSFEDKVYLYAIYTSMLTAANDNRGWYIVPSEYSGSSDRTQDTTANLFSSMLMQQYTSAEQLISGNEYSAWVEPDDDYRFEIYDPRGGVYWDSSFTADLEKISNVSFAHMPLYGDRFDANWKNTMNSRMPLLGNRGPKDGVDDPKSLTYGRNGQWGGHVVMGDGSISFITTFTTGGVFYEDSGERQPDNLFLMETGADGDDAILAFTESMSASGPVLQYD